MSCTIARYYVFSQFVYYGGPPMAINAVLAFIADGGRAIVVIYREGVGINYFSFSLLILLKPLEGDIGQPLSQRLPGVRYARTTKPCRWRGKRLHHGDGVCMLVFS